MNSMYKGTFYYNIKTKNKYNEEIKNVYEEGFTLYSPSEKEIIELCNKELANFKVPKKVLFMKELPITRLAKVDRPAILQQFIEEYNLK